MTWIDWLLGLIPQPKPQWIVQKHLAAICVGHSRSGDNGASSVDGTTEWAFNRSIAEEVVSLLRQRGIDAFVVSKYEGSGYTAAMKWLASHLKEREATLALEIHFNSADSAARGSEWLCWESSSKGRKLAESLHIAYLKLFPLSRDRGVKLIDKSERGALFLSLTSCPAAICEPFFGSNRDEWATAIANKEKLAKYVVDAVEAYTLTTPV